MGCFGRPIKRCLATLCLFSLVLQGNGCDEGWASYSSRCYKVFLKKDSPLFGAIECSSEDSSLASVSSEGKLLFLSQLVSYVNETQFWIGLYVENGVPVWADGTNAQHQGYIKPITAENSHMCPAFTASGIVMLPCFYMLGYICERRDYHDYSYVTCPSYAFNAKHSNHCIWMVTASTRFNYTDEETLAQANDVCSFNGGHVAELSEIFHESVSNFLSVVERDKNYWLSDKWENLNSSHFGAFFGAFASNGSGSCMAISFDSSSRFKFFVHQIDCEEKANIICFSDPNAIPATTEMHTETTAVPTVASQERFRSADTISRLDTSCPHGYNWKEDTRTGFCFWETSYETTKLSWADARSYCQSYGGDLASFHSSAEEQIGLSYHLHSSSHRYWIGLSYDKITNRFMWADGSPLNYTNWDPDHPVQWQRSKSCVQMDPSSVHWVLSYCGELCWFICKAPQQLNPKKPALPTPEPMVRCKEEVLSLSYYFEGYCYSTIDLYYSWHRAKTYCANFGSHLVSVHSEREVDFLIRLMHQDKSLTGNRVWIGLNSGGYDGHFFWSDGTAYDFFHWDDNEPNNAGDDEHCVNMYATSAFWNDESCHSNMAFVCKKFNDTFHTSTLSTPVPPAGNCPEGWYTFNNQCFLVVGYNESHRKSFLQASLHCKEEGGYLTSVHNAKEQAFLAFLIQNLKSDTWIGLTDRLSEGQYHWMDGSPLLYTNWVYGSAQTHESTDCVFLSYNSPVSGAWHVADCDRELPYICEKRKDSKIKTHATPKTIQCLYPQGWLKQDLSCYMLFSNESTFADAKRTCESYHSHLVSISDTTVEAVVNYLTAGSEKSYWMGLTLTKEHEFKWSNDWPLTISRWDTNEPYLTEDKDSCFVVLLNGRWSHKVCSEKMPFICQVTSGPPPALQSVSGSCPLDDWVDVGDEYCYSFGSSFNANSWSQANLNCFSTGGNLVSIHSLSQLSKLKEYLKKRETIWVTSYFIGLTTSENGGFIWSDFTPVNFVNWAKEEPEDPSLHCVHMHPDTMEWYTTSCNSAKDYICSIKKDVIMKGNNTEKLIQHVVKSQGPSGGVIAAIILLIVFATLVISAALVFRFCPVKIPWSRLPSERVTSFENALYKTNLELESEDLRTTLHVHE